ncbi:aquaporin AQPAn.G-like isoform X2 [Episyrphus balteatus]|nr:aquaporin AQPAn.G-like isoform X2 [Episyrphus balteatus]XP_055850388.1 aquaporin AQPAn.G-like isoform X2 [Episyrphus balteatus]XP_055850393.1 aquaporin AQPAn.G-like isoform X2 [Episyrphus balteatus]
MKLSVVDKITVFLGELISTGLLIFLGCMGCIKTDIFPNNHLQLTFNFGLVIMILIQSFGCVSGAHMNPAVTLAAVIYKLVTPIVGAIYVVGQFLGAFIGYGLLKALVPANTIKVAGAEHGLCVTTVSPEISTLQGLGIEFVLTTVLIFVCCGVWDPRNAKHHDSVAIKFGLAVASLACTGGPFTGASMNPARSFAPALWNADFTDHWIYWVGPLAAALIGSIAYKAVFRREEPVEKDPKLRAMEELPLR